ncbi:MAG: hypothetical protein Q9167_003403 [Letrouitia subvulpina]
MAKVKPLPTLVEMESKLGYKVDLRTYPDESLKRFYSDLRLVPYSTYEKTRREYEEYERKTYRKNDEAISGKSLPESDIVKLQSAPPCSNSIIPMFFKLPQEVRNKIYTFALPLGTWQIRGTDNCAGSNFAGNIGDPSGFYFPLSNQLTVLRVNKQMRQESLPLAYRRTVFHLDNVDDLIKLLVAAGRIGRNNIESLELMWESKADIELKWDEDSDFGDQSWTLPILHAVKCAQLLKQCKRLKNLRFYVENDLITNMPVDAFQNDPGIRELCSVRPIKTVQIWNLEYEPIEQCRLAEWLKKQIESPEEEKN